MPDECIAVLGNAPDAKFLYFVRFTCDRGEHSRSAVKLCEALGQKYLLAFKVVKSMEV